MNTDKLTLPMTAFISKNQTHNFVTLTGTMKHQHNTHAILKRISKQELKENINKPHTYYSFLHVFLQYLLAI